MHVHIHYLDGYNSQDVLTTDHKLARNHFSLQGRAFDQLAKGFSDQGDGDLVMGILKDSRLRELNRAIGLDPASTPTLDEVQKIKNIINVVAVHLATPLNVCEHALPYVI